MYALRRRPLDCMNKHNPKKIAHWDYSVDAAETEESGIMPVL